MRVIFWLGVTAIFAGAAAIGVPGPEFLCLRVTKSKKARTTKAATYCMLAPGMSDQL